MTRKQQRLAAIGLVLGGVIIAAFLTLYALRNNVTFFYSPSDILGPDPRPMASGRPIKLGGMVRDGSVERNGLDTTFVVTDFAYDITVTYEGLLPSLFKEGQGVVATGHMDGPAHFTATQLLAKHDENYMPPEVARSLKDKPQEKKEP